MLESYLAYSIPDNMHSLVYRLAWTEFGGGSQGTTKGETRCENVLLMDEYYPRELR
jgi:hypothetical protein